MNRVQIWFFLSTCDITTWIEYDKSNLSIEMTVDKNEFPIVTGVEVSFPDDMTAEEVATGFNEGADEG